jgi:hypothetical protein
VITNTPGDGSGEFVNVVNPHLELYDPSNNLVASGAALADGRNERLVHASLTTGTYRVRVTSEAGTSGEYLLGVGIAPVVTLNPSSQLATVGSLASFNATATGDPAPTVQWQVSTDGGANFNNIGGATSGPLSFATVVGDNGKQYRAVFSNAFGAATTTSATLTVLTAQEAWRQLYFGITTNTGNAADSADPDGDGYTNLFEYVAGLVPTDPLSRFNLRVAAVEGQPAQKAIIFSPVAAGRSYLVKYKTGLTDATWTTLTNTTTSDNGTERTVTDLGATGPKFYRVEITLP